MSYAERRADEIDETRRLVLERDGGRCRYCHGPGWQLAHRIPQDKRYVKRYGRAVIYHPDNLVLTCDRCNSKAEVDPKTQPLEAARIIMVIEEKLR